MVYLCGTKGGKVNCKKIKTVSLFLLALVMWHQCSVMLFSHTHYVNGQTVTHSHPYSGKSGGHSHTSLQFATIAMLSSFTALVWYFLFTFAPLQLTVKMVRRVAVFLHLKSGTAAHSLRGPPATAVSFQ